MVRFYAVSVSYRNNPGQIVLLLSAVVLVISTLNVYPIHVELVSEKHRNTDNT